ncbi:MAG: hypothetical protein CFE34_06000 [Rhodobacteraceae bacterium PARR1]|nr:MAG: hypothetical protein CFE34_06000 [Rhodobacteraceae bacterium PARR1]
MPVQGAVFRIGVMHGLAWHVTGMYAQYWKNSGSHPVTPRDGDRKLKVSQVRSDQIDIKLMTWGSIRITLDELMIALRHRLVVITYFGCWVAIYPIRYRPDVPYLDIWREILIFLLSQVVVISSLPVMVALVARANRHKPVPAVYVSAVVFFGTILGCLSIVLGFRVFSGSVSVDVSTILIYAVLQLVLTELVGALVLTFFLPTILDDIRTYPFPEDRPAITAGPPTPLIGVMQDDTTSDAASAAKDSETVGNGDEAARPVGDLRRAVPLPAEVVVTGKRLPKHQLRIIRAAGNYLDITLRSDKMFVQATMRSVLQQMDADDGLLLHRSLWLASDEVESFQRQGMDILVHTRDGEVVKTARSRQSEVLAWLKQQSIPRRSAQTAQSG